MGSRTPLLSSALARATHAPLAGTALEVLLIESRTNISVSGHPGATSPALDASLPIPYRAQTPLAIRAITRPLDDVAQLAIGELDEKRLHGTVRTAFDESARRPAPGPTALLIDTEQLGRSLGSQARELLERVE